MQWVKSCHTLSHNGSEVEGGGFRVWHFSPHCNLCDLTEQVGGVGVGKGHPQREVGHSPYTEICGLPPQ